jgi:glutamate synthase domain-containing protein 1
LDSLEVEPPRVKRYFVRVRDDYLDRFVMENDLNDIERIYVEDEIIYQTSFMINSRFYSSTGRKRAFILSHGKDMIVFKIVGYADEVIKYYMLEDVKAHIWIGHHRYPTKGKVWHPGGAHPFIGLHHCLVHNGDFSNYYSIYEYLLQKNIVPLFLTDTEVAALLFDLLYRQYRYPLEYVIEAIAPTTERDYQMLPEEKKAIYSLIQYSHIWYSPDGPWFFIIGGNNIYEGYYELMGITDTAMLRPQVFALYNGLGFIASEKQAIDALLNELYIDGFTDSFVADRYWFARGGSYSDGGAFIFRVDYNGDRLITTNKFGDIIG